MKAFDVVGYTYAADVYCTTCMDEIAADRVQDVDPDRSVIVADALNIWATLAGIDADDEATYDSDEYPKVVLASMVEGDEHCGRCSELLI